MKVKDLIHLLAEVDGEAEVQVASESSLSPSCLFKPLFEVEVLWVGGKDKGHDEVILWPAD